MMNAFGRFLRGLLPWISGVGVLGGLIAATVLIGRAPIPEDADYIGSDACGTCHWKVHGAWHGSLHPKMMRRVDRQGVVVADFQAEDSPFDLDDAVWAIGSRFEQQFMGHGGENETLLPGAWLVDEGRWKTKGWDGWQVPVPLERCHGCHTVGLDVETGDFVEPGIGCESCHGPGSWHRNTLGIGQVASTLDAQVCGQCHTRGRSVDGKYFFPVGYEIGESLDAYFRETAPMPGQGSAAWWGNGRERKRHQEYYAWKQGGHADSLKSLKDGYDGRYGEVGSACLRCHSAEVAVDPRRERSLDAVEHGITCAVCHNVHGGLQERRHDCSYCHENGAFYHQPERNAKHIACGDDADVVCIDCHMPLTAKNGGGLNLRSHHPGIVPPSDTEALGVPSSCANGDCHRDKQTGWLQAQFEAHYP